MDPRLISRSGGIATLVLLLACTPVAAAELETNDFQSTCSNCAAEADWNPTLTCDSASNAQDLMACLIGSGSPGCHLLDEAEGPQSIGGGGPGAQDVQENPPDEDGCIVTHETGNYLVSLLPWPRVGLEIFREDLSEIDRLTFREDYPELTWVELHVEQPNLRARIDVFDGAPSDGTVTVTLNGRSVRVDTGDYSDSPSMAADLVTSIQRAGFEASYANREITVGRDLWQDAGITRVRVECTDPNLVRSELSLAPKGTAGIGGPRTL